MPRPRKPWLAPRYIRRHASQVRLKGRRGRKVRARIHRMAARYGIKLSFTP